VSASLPEPAVHNDVAPHTDCPPPTRRDDLVEDLHGHEVADPYRWLEAPATDPELAAWVRTQAACTEHYLDDLPSRRAFREHLGRLWDHARRGAPWRKGDRWFQLANDGSQNQDVLWTAPAVADAPRATVPPAEAWVVLLDPNAWSEEGTASLTGLAITDDGSRATFARSDAGSDWVVWRVVEVATGTVLEDEVPWSKFYGAAWLPGGQGFLYSAYEPPEADQAYTAAQRDQQLRYHHVGTDPSEDVLVYARPDQPEWGFSPAISHDDRWLVIVVTHGTDPNNRIHVAPIEDGEIGEIRPLLDANDASYSPLGVIDDELVVLTDLDASRGRVVTIDLASGELRRELVPAGEDRLQDAVLVGASTSDQPGWIVTTRLHHATAQLSVHDVVDGTHLGDVELPGLGTIPAVAGGRKDDAVHFTFETFTGPAAVLQVDLDDAPPSTFTAVEITPPSAPPADDLVVEQVRVHHDEVTIPLFLIHRRDVTPNGEVPTVLWGYGGFNIPVTPMYRPGFRAWVDGGGLLAVACLRGGGEYGRTWHDDGRLANKEHVFDDALACSAWLTGRRRDEVHASALTDAVDVDAVWSAPSHLGIEGRSNGGLLVGACMTREPDAFGCAVPEVGVLDLARFHRFTIGWAWASDYGSPDDPDDLEVLLRYSPYHRIEEGRAYPPTMITTGDTDDRVVPAHSYKFAAALQRAQDGDAPVLLRVDIAAGHGMGKPVSKLLDERADVLAFHAHHLGLAVSLPERSAHG
jgi:prolyl oligopeptidase